MRSQIRERTLADSALRYIQDRLDNGSTLARLVREALSWDQGRVFTFLPPTVTAEEADDFWHGGKLPPAPPSEFVKRMGLILKPVPNTSAELTAFLRAFLAKDRYAAGLFENLMASPNDPYLKKLRSRILVHQNEVYHSVTSATNTDEAVMSTIKEARSIPDVTGFLAVVPEILGDLENGLVLNHAHLLAFARRTSTVIVGAYDGESYLIWEAA